MPHPEGSLSKSRSKSKSKSHLPPNTLACAFAIHHILAHVATHPLVTRTEQDAYLARLTKRYQLPYHSGSYGHTVHDGKSLRRTLVQVMRNHGVVEGLDVRAGKTAVDELFEKGVEVLEDEYVRRVEEAVGEGRDDLEGMVRKDDGDESGSEGEGVDSGEDEQSSEDDEDEDGEYTPTLSERTRIAERRKLGIRSSAPAHHTPGFYSMKKYFEERFEDVDADDMSSFRQAISANKAKSRRDDANIRKRKVAVMSGEDEEGMQDMLHAREPVGIARPTSMCADESTSGKRSSAAAQWLKSPSDGHSDLQEACFPTASASHLQGQILQLRSTLRLTVTRLLNGVSHEHCEPVQADVNPVEWPDGVNTHTIYSGGVEKCGVNMQADVDPQAGVALESLIASYLLEHVFSQSFEWSTPVSLRSNDLFNRYVAPLLDSKGIDSHSLLVEAAAGQIRHRDFIQSVVRPRAVRLAGELLRVVTAQLQKLNPRGQDSVGCQHIRRRALGMVIQDAILLQAFLMTEVGEVEWMCFEPGGGFDEAYMTATSGAVTLVAGLAFRKRLHVASAAPAVVER